MPQEKKSVFQTILISLGLAAADANIGNPAMPPTAPSNTSPDLTLIFQNLVEGVLAVDQKGAVIEVNPAFCALFGVDGARAPGRSFLEIARHARLEALRQDCLRTRATVTEEVTLFAPQERTFEVQWIPLLEAGAPNGAVLVLHEITRLRELEKVRQEFVANVSHELRTPLAAVKGFAETLQDGAMDDKKHRMEFIEAIIRHADRLTEVVNDLLALSSIESGKNPPKKEAVDLESLVLQTVQGLKPLASRVKVEIRVALQDLSALQTDKNYLQRILTNLLTNAIQYNKEGGWVEVSAEKQGAVLKVLVKDSGLGIPEKDLPRIFERFYRVDKDRSRERGGTGLGLSLVKHMVETLGGKVGVESEMDKGSTFWFTLTG